MTQEPNWTVMRVLVDNHGEKTGSNQCISKNINFCIRRVDSLEKTLMLGKIEGRRRKGQQRMRWLDGIIN